MDTQALPQTLTIRTKSSGPKLRAGLVLGTLREWALHEIDRTVDGFKKLIALAEDPAIEVHGQDEDGTWHPLPAIEDLKAGIAAMTAANDAGGQVPVNTLLPAAGPTLERDQPDTKLPQSAGSEGTEEDQTRAQDTAQNAAAFGAKSDQPDAEKAEGDDGNPAPEPDAAADNASQDETKA